MIYLFYLTLLVIAELAYFKIAYRYNIIDKPNHRSSHTVITIRGGGIIFPLAVVVWFLLSSFQYPMFVSGLFLISLVSFVDDITGFPKRWRLVAQLLAMCVVFLQLHLFTLLPPVFITALFILFVGVVNAYNFMDGINGITGAYSLVTLFAMYWINAYQVHFTDAKLLLLIILSIIVFNFFNFRKKALCFAGDVGSISMAFIICFLLIKLIVQTSDLRYILLLAVYGIDAIFTIILRLLKGENIFLPHRSHLYQLLVNEQKYQHLMVASLYALTQLFVDYGIIKTIALDKYQVIIIFLIILIIIYIILRVKAVRHKNYKNT